MAAAASSIETPETIKTINEKIKLEEKIITSKNYVIELGDKISKGSFGNV